MTPDCWLGELASLTIYNQSSFVSWLSSYGSIAVLYLALRAAGWLARRWAPGHRHTVLAVIWGFLSLPLSTWMYFHVGMDCWRALFVGLPGTLLFALFHFPFLWVDSFFAPTVLPGFIHPHIFGGFIWASIFGSLAWLYDMKMSPR